MCSNPALSQYVLTTYHTTFCEMPPPQTFPNLATARKILPSVTPAARVHWYGADLATLTNEINHRPMPLAHLDFIQLQASEFGSAETTTE
jgi:hypothetical protein